MNLRQLNELGLKRFEEFLDSLYTDQPETYPADLLNDPEATETVRPEAEVEAMSLGTRYQAGAYLHERLSHAGIRGLERNVGIWAWLALLFFDSLCPADNKGRRTPGERARWIPDVGNYRKYYRHLLAGPWRIFRAHQDNPARALALLCSPIHRPGELPEQLASRQELVTNNAVVEVATLLYVNPATRQSKRGAGGKGPGSPRRLADVLNQFDLTWDLYSTATDSLLSMLPSEFDRFRP